jgi:hypothetical protein
MQHGTLCPSVPPQLLESFSSLLVSQILVATSKPQTQALSTYILIKQNATNLNLT